jgi:tRNA (guanine-N7-)-methyltransferase
MISHWYLAAIMDLKTRSRRPRLVETKTLPNPTQYVLALNGEYREWAYDEERCLENRGRWRGLFGFPESVSLDLEIGTGNGYFFAHRAAAEPKRLLVGIELKYKPLIQSIRRARRNGSLNAKIARYDASCLEDLFSVEELNHVFIHHPDPWPRKRDWKHRLIQDEFLETLWTLMRPGSYVDFKTDSEDYFDWAIPIFERSKFKKMRATRDLHRSEWATQNFVTHFEQIFLLKGQPIFYCRFEKPQK